MEYKYRTKGELVSKKIQNDEPLTKEDKQIIKEVMQNPLQEFIRREAPFRLTDIFGLSEEEIDEDLLEKTEEAIRYVIDCDEDLYDSIDRKISELLDQKEEN